MSEQLCARLLGTYQGKRVYCFPVRVQENNSHMLRTERTRVICVQAFTAADAANAVRDDYATRAETEITAFGPRGGKAAYRYVGWESAIGNAMVASHFLSKQPAQLRLF